MNSVQDFIDHLLEKMPEEKKRRQAVLSFDYTDDGLEMSDLRAVVIDVNDSVVTVKIGFVERGTTGTE
jgi:hypothetical protein